MCLYIYALALGAAAFGLSLLSISLSIAPIVSQSNKKLLKSSKGFGLWREANHLYARAADYCVSYWLKDNGLTTTTITTKTSYMVFAYPLARSRKRRRLNS